MLIAVVVGTRPEIIKLAPIIKEIQSTDHKLLVVHTGQHYDANMSQSFIDSLHIPTDYFLTVKETKQADQTGLIMLRFEKVLVKERPDIVIVEGDTNSALGCALASAKCGIDVVHVEAGCRSFDRKQQEEINRVVIDHIATINFPATHNCWKNLEDENLTGTLVLGHPLVDLIDSLSMHDIIPTVRDKYPPKNFALLTMHRRENIEDKNRLNAIITALNDLDLGVPIIFPIHPHTKKQIKKFGLDNYINKDKIKIIAPVPYFESLALIKIARFVMTDSGGVQQEAAILGTTCFTLRDRTEWPETIDAGLNTLVDSNIRLIHDHIIMQIHSDNKHKASADIFGKVGASKRIVETILKNIVNNK